MKGLDQLSLYIPIPVDDAENGTITGYYGFIRTKTSVGHIAYDP